MRTAELKHSILVYLSISGTPTPDLGAISIKLIDCIDDALVGKDPGPEMDKIALIVVRVAANALIERLNCIEGAHPHASIIRMNLESELCHHNDEPLVEKYRCLRGIAIALHELKIITGVDYPPITDLEGNEL